MPWEEIQDMLAHLKPYPECFNSLDKKRTPLHSAAMSGNWSKIKLLLADLTKRYKVQFQDSISAGNNKASSAVQPGSVAAANNLNHDSIADPITIGVYFS